MAAHILVADDEAPIRQSLRSALTQEGFEVSVAASGGGVAAIAPAMRFAKRAPMPATIGVTKIESAVTISM